jgi:Ca-activated chloride channel family protein
MIPNVVFGLDRPQILLGLIPLAVFAGLRVLQDRKYRPVIAPFALRYRLSRFLFWVFVAALTLVLAGPHWGQRQVIEYRRGLDVVLALDMSRSMEVRDLETSRLERAVVLGRELTERAGGIRLGTAFGRGNAALAVPLTEDSAVIMSFLESLGDMVFTGTGTNLESLVNAASSAFLDSFPSRRVIVLLSDGESLSGSLVRAAEQARSADISIAVLGLGTEEGGLVPGTEGQEERHVSRLQRQVLEEAAEHTGGIYLDGNDPDAGVRLWAFLESLALESETGGGRRESRPRWRFFLVIALAALGLSKLCLRESRKKNRFSQAAVLLLLFTLPSCSPVSGKLLVVEGNFYHSQGRYDEAIQAYSKALDYPETQPYAEYGLGTVYTSLEEMPAALGRYDAAAGAAEDFPLEGREELNYRVHYNRGVVLFWSGDFEKAAAAFRAALEIDGSRIDAKRNLELSLLSLSRKKNQETADSGDQDAEDDRLVTLFQYLNLKEQNQWKSREWEEDTASGGPDY